jgi:hypothetical protein
MRWIALLGLSLVRLEAAESELLAQFLPRFQVAAGDCDVAPAEFAAEAKSPQVRERNGTIYGQVLRVERKDLRGEWVELHYYHLWGRDCGKNGHALDAEHVSGLIQRVGSQWRAVYWYAAAHEDTPCDAGMAARADALDSELRGPRVWISAGKHASFLSVESCRAGCMADRCEDTRELAVQQVLPLPLEADWVRSAKWPLQAKTGSDFPEGLVAALADPRQQKLVSVKPYLLPARAALGATGIGMDKTDSSLELAAKKTGGAISTAKKRVKRFLGL